MDSTHRARAGWRYASGKGVSTGQAEGGGGGGKDAGEHSKDGQGASQTARPNEPHKRAESRHAVWTTDASPAAGTTRN